LEAVHEEEGANQRIHANTTNWTATLVFISPVALALQQTNLVGCDVPGFPLVDELRMGAIVTDKLYTKKRRHVFMKGKTLISTKSSTIDMPQT